MSLSVSATKLSHLLPSANVNSSLIESATIVPALPETFLATAEEAVTLIVSKFSGN